MPLNYLRRFPHSFLTTSFRNPPPNSSQHSPPQRNPKLLFSKAPIQFTSSKPLLSLSLHLTQATKLILQNELALAQLQRRFPNPLGPRVLGRRPLAQCVRSLITSCQYDLLSFSFALACVAVLWCALCSWRGPLPDCSTSARCAALFARFETSARTLPALRQSSVALVLLCVSSSVLRQLLPLCVTGFGGATGTK